MTKIDTTISDEARLMYEQNKKRIRANAALTEDLQAVIGDDWTAINSTKRLRGALLWAARLLRRHGESNLASEWEAWVKNMPRRIDAEGINVVLMGACLEAGLIPD